MIGLKTGTVKLVMHQDKWDNEAKRTIKELKDLLGNTAIDIQHIGVQLLFQSMQSLLSILR